VSPRTLLAPLVALAAAAVLGGCAVVPSVQWQQSTFEGFPVISYVPDHPRGIAYFFHGTNGSANFATKLETTDAINWLVARGYGFVSTSSTERTGDQRWNASDPSLTTNPDLARLARLQAHLVATTGLEANTPIVGVGMSNGARFVTLWGQAWKNAGYPVKAIWASNGRIAAPFSSPGQLTVPTYFTTAVNDFTSPQGGIAGDYIRTLNSGTPTGFYSAPERDLNAAQYERIPGVDSTEARQIVDALIATGVWDASGHRIEPDIQQAAARAQTATLPPSVRADAQAIRDETFVLLAVHQFSAQHVGSVVAFFDRFVP
jgi:hypothetical protein